MVGKPMTKERVALLVGILCLVVLLLVPVVHVFSRVFTLFAVQTVIPEEEQRKADEVADIAEPIIRGCLEERYGLKDKDYILIDVEALFRNDGGLYGSKTKHYEGYFARFQVLGKEYVALFQPEQGTSQAFWCDFQIEQLSKDIEDYLRENVLIGDPISVKVYPGRKYNLPENYEKNYYLLDHYYDSTDSVLFTLEKGGLAFDPEVEIYYINYGFDFTETYSEILPSILTNDIDIRIEFIEFKTVEAFEIFDMVKSDRSKIHDIDSGIDWYPIQSVRWSYSGGFTNLLPD